MKDTSLNNALFQAEFDTRLQLLDVMKFIGERFELADIIRQSSFQKADIDAALTELKMQPTTADMLYKIDDIDLIDELSKRGY